MLLRKFISLRLSELFFFGFKFGLEIFVCNFLLLNYLVVKFLLLPIKHLNAANVNYELFCQTLNLAIEVNISFEILWLSLAITEISGGPSQKYEGI